MRDKAQHDVAIEMAVRIVDLFEVVDIDRDYANYTNLRRIGDPASDGGGDPSLSETGSDSLIECFPIQQPREVMVIRVVGIL